MNRLTQKDEQGNWCIQELSWENITKGAVIGRKMWEIVYAGLCKLKDYEDTGLDPGEVEQLKKDIEDINGFMKSEAAKLLIELGEERKKYCWIPTEEKAPPESGDYLVSLIIPGYNQGMPVTNWLNWDTEEQVWIDINGDPVVERVIAWKPIPDPYGEIDESDTKISGQ